MRKDNTSNGTTLLVNYRNDGSPHIRYGEKALGHTLNTSAFFKPVHNVCSAPVYLYGRNLVFRHGRGSNLLTPFNKGNWKMKL